MKFTQRGENKYELIKMHRNKWNVIFWFFSNFSALQRCQKIGEGVFGEVFRNQVGRTSYVIKIIPIEGAEIVNGAVQKRYNEILQEVVISQELSGLRHDDNEYQTAGFVEVLNVRLVQGRYPAHLLAIWESYDKWHHSENESPECFGENQLYVVFELANSGTDLEKFEFKNADQSYSVFKQVIRHQLCSNNVNHSQTLNTDAGGILAGGRRIKIQV